MKEKSVVSILLQDAYIPKMAKVRQNFPRPLVENPAARVRELYFQQKIRKMVKPGMSVAVTCGSRKIANLKEIIREICVCTKELGAHPFIIPAMGSHGGATAEGQREIIEGYGVTEEYCQAPIKSSMEVVKIGYTQEGQEVYIDKNAAGADGIIVVGRIKPHTDFRGPYESGVMKMMVIGLGKQHGAEVFHRSGPKHMAHKIPLFGKAIIEHAPILFGFAIIENAYDETAQIEVMPREEIEGKEPPLLEEAKRLMAKSYIEDVDLLIVDQVGKDISGDGMDPNITGRFCNPYVSGGMNAKKMAVLDISEDSHGQMVGIGYGDTTTRRAFEKCDLEASYPNALTSTTFSPFRIPLILKNDREAIGACLKYCGDNDKERPRVIRIKDTLHMGEIWVSEALIPEVEKHPYMEVMTELMELPFDEKGNLW